MRILPRLYLAMLATAVVATLAVVVFLRRPAAEPEYAQRTYTSPLTGSGGVGYRAVFSSTDHAKLTHDHLATQRFEEVSATDQEKRSQVGHDANEVSSIATVIERPQGKQSYYRQWKLFVEEDLEAPLHWWINPTGSEVVLPDTDVAEVMGGDRKRNGWSEVQALINSQQLQSIGSQTLLGQTIRGARWTAGNGRVVEAWFTDPYGLRVRTTVVQNGTVAFAEEATELQQNIWLDESHFQVMSPTVTTTVTLRSRVVQPSDEVFFHDYYAAILPNSAQFTTDRAFTMERDFSGPGSYEATDWGSLPLDTDVDMLGWMVVQDVHDASNHHIRIIQNDGEVNIPFGKVDLWPYWYGRMAPDLSSSNTGITVANSNNRIRRDPNEIRVASWRDDDDGGQFLFEALDFDPTDVYLQGLVAAIKATRPY